MMLWSSRKGRAFAVRADDRLTWTGGKGTGRSVDWLVPGVGQAKIGVQPLLGLEGDPMRLLFERDLTPHPQYAAAYKWLQEVRAVACARWLLRGNRERCEDLVNVV
jgi:magnesium chelatase subunit H